MINFLLASLAVASPSLSVKVDGDGYLRLARDGRVVYASRATFSVTDGHLATTGGAEPLPSISIPGATTAIAIDLQGEVFAVGPTGKALVGQLVLAIFPKTSALTPDGDFLLAADRPTLGTPGDGLNGVIRSADQAVIKTNPAPVKPIQAAPKQTAPVITSQEHKAVTTSAAPIKGAEIVIHPESIVQAESFILSEVADIHAEPNLATKLGGVDMGRSPIVGVTRGLDTNFVLSKLRTAGYKIDNISISTPEGAHILRACQKVTASQLLDAAKLAVKDQLGLSVPLRLNMDVSDISVPLGQLELRPNTVMKTSSAISLMIDIRVDDKHWTSRSLNLSPQHIGEGVKAGQIVKITVRLNGASLQCAGRARTAAWIGESITVQTDTGAVQTGTVTGPDTVEVKL